MATLNGYPVEKGDVVYDLLLGYGSVTAVTAGNITVKFGNRSMLYTSGGFYNGSTTQRIYWDNPVVIPPPPNKAKWSKLITVMEAITNLL